MLLDHPVRMSFQPGAPEQCETERRSPSQRNAAGPQAQGLEMRLTCRLAQ